MNAANAPLLCRSTRSKASSSSASQSSRPSAVTKRGRYRVRREHRHRPDGCRTVAAATGRVRRPAGGTGHAVPALGKPDDLPSAGHDLGQFQGRLVGLRPGCQQQHLRQARRQPAERLGEIDHRPRQHPGEEVIEAADHLRHDRDDLGVRVAQDRAHLAAREVEHLAPCGVLDERSGRPLGDERGPRRPVPNEVALSATEIRFVDIRPILTVEPATQPQAHRQRVCVRAGRRRWRIPLTQTNAEHVISVLVCGRFSAARRRGRRGRAGVARSGGVRASRRSVPRRGGLVSG